MNDQADMLIHPTSRLLSLCCGLIAWVLVGEVGAYHPYVIATTPTQNNHTTLTNSNIVGTFSVGMSAATTTTFVVQGSMTGKRAGIYSGETTTTITFDPTSDFIPGEDIEVIFTGGVTTGYTNTVNNSIFSGGHIVRFRTAVGAGPVNFTASRPIGPGTSSATTGLAVADIDGDGDLDVVVGNDGTQNVAYLQTLAAFTTSANYGSGADLTNDLALGDLNGNGKVDVVLAEGVSTSLAYRNNGSGTFNAGATSLAAGDVRGVEMGDFNGDGHLDIALGFHSLLNKLVITDGAGAVSRVNLWAVGGTDTRSIAVGDTDNDGDLDVAVGNNTANQNVVYLNDGVGNIAAGTDNFGSGADNTNSVVLGDINADGFLDVGSGNAAQQNAFYLNDGAGNFTGGTINFGTGTDNTLSLALADFDGDGDQDVAVGNNAEQNVVYKNDGTGSFVAGTANFGTGADISWRLAPGDLNGDGFIDIAVGNNAGQPNFIYYNATQPTVSSITPTANLRNAMGGTNISATFSTAMTAAAAASFRVMGSMTGLRAGFYSGGGTTTLTFDPSTDFKQGEEVQVIFTAGFSINSTTLLSTQEIGLAKSHVYQFRAATVVGPGDWTSVFSHFVSSSTQGLETGDVDGDGDIDVVVGNNGAENFALLNNGSGALTGSTVFAANDATVTLDLGDVDGDGDLDVVTANFVGQSVVRENNGLGTFGGAINVGGASDNTRPMVFGDADGDGGLDIAQGIDGGQNRVHFNSGLSIFPVSFPVSNTFGTGTDRTKHLDWGDADGDGDLDLYVANFSEANKIYLNDGVGNFTTGNTFGSGSDMTHWLDVGDIDGDGDADVVMANMSGEQNFPAVNNGLGTFTGSAAFGLTTVARAVVLGDGDGDGDLDAAITYDGGSQSAIYTNDGTGVFSGGPFNFAQASAQTMIAAWADMDGDGDLDLAVGNNGSPSAIHYNEIAPTVTNLLPTENENSAPAANNLTATFSLAMSAGTSQNFAVFGSMRGKRLGVYSGNGTTGLTFDPSGDFLPNEMVQTTFTGGFTAGIPTTTGIALSKPFVWSYRTQAAVAPVNFADYAINYGSGSGNSNALAWADIDADGDVDLAVGNGGAQNIAYKNVARNFTTSVTFGTGTDNTFALAFGDFDADGDPDLAVGNAGGAQDAAYLNDGSGNFSAGTKTFGAATTNTEGLAIGDVDGDGALDIAVGRDNGEQDVAYLNDGAGNFIKTVNFGTGSDQTKSVALGDIDGDGDLDVAVTNDAEQDVAYLNDGAGNFSAGSKNYGGASDAGRSASCGDFDSNGKLDIAVGNNGGQNAAYLNDGVGNFTAGTKTFGSGTDNTFGIALGDANGDGNIDVAAANNAAQNAVYLNDGVGNFTAGTTNFGTGSDTSEELIFADLIQDLDLDIAVANAGQQNIIYLNETAPTLTIPKPEIGAVNIQVGNNISAVFSEAMSRVGASPFRAVGALTGAKAGVFSGDGTTTLSFNPTTDFKAGEVVEVVFANGITRGGVISSSKKLPMAKAYVWRFTTAAGTGPATFNRIARPFGTGADASVALALADIDNDGDLDVGVGNNTSGQNAAYLNDGAGNFVGSKTFGTGSDNTEGIFFGDIDNDGDLDVGVGNNTSGQNAVYLNDGLGNFSAGTQNAGSGSDDTRAVAAGDLDGDGDLDVAVGNASAQQNAAYLNDGSGDFSAGTQNFGSGSDHTLAVALGDLDQDGDLDIAVGNTLQQSAVYLNDGKGGFVVGSKNFGTAADDARDVFFADIDADGDQDLAVARGSSQQNIIYLNDGSGNLSPGTKNFGPGSDSSTGTVFADVDGDGDLDAIASNSTQNAVYRNDGVGNFTVDTKTFGTGSDDTRAVAAGDVDGDGTLDIAAVNAGAQNLVHLNLDTPTLTATTPTAHLNNAAKTTNISAVFSAAMTAPTTASFAVIAGYTGKRTGVHSGASTTTLAFDPSADFIPGEEVQAIFSASGTSGTRNKAGVPLADGYVLRFRVQASAGPGKFPSTGIAFGSGADNTRSVAFGDFNADGKLDIVAGNNGGQDAAYLNNGVGAAVTTKNFGSGSDATYALSLGDLDSDGDLDAAMGRNGAQNAAYLNDGGGNLATAKNFGTGSDATYALAIGDADGDGDLDVAAGNGSAQQNVVYKNDGSGNFSTGGNFGSADNTSAVVCADVDNDGDLDVAVGNDAAQNTVYLNDGEGGFVTVGSKTFGTGSDATKALFFADVNGDGHLDAGVGNDAAQNAVYLNDGSGNFTAGTRNFGTGTDITMALSVGDIEGDGDLDLGVGNDATQNVIYINDGSGNFTTSTNFGTGTDATKALAIGDADFDGDMDLAVGNNPSQNAIFTNSAFTEVDTSRGLAGTSPAILGASRTVLRVGAKGDGVVGVQSLVLALGDLGSATGLVAKDFDSLSVYASPDTIFDAADSLVVTTTSVNVGSATKLDFTATATIAKDTVRYFMAVAAVDTGAIIGHTFKVGFASGGLGTTIGGMGTAVAANDTAKAIMTPEMKETTVAFGLLGIAKALPGTEVKLLGVGMTGDGVQTVNGIAVTLADLTIPTGVDTSNIDSLNFYVSTDSVLSTGSDSLLAIVPRGSIVLGAAVNFSPATPHVPPIAQERFYLVSAVVDSTVVDNLAFKPSFATGGIATSKGALGTAVAASDSNQVAIQVKATKLALIQAPADASRIDTSDAVVSGVVFATQPIIAAQDEKGNIDEDFAETVVASVTSGGGTLRGVASKIVVKGRADFATSGMSYKAVADGEAFTLTFDDEAGGDDLTSVATTGLSADAVATKLVFTKQPAPLLDPGLNFAPDSIAVTAKDINDLIDRDFSGKIHIQAVGAENTSAIVDGLSAMPADSVAAASGVAIWTELKLPTADLIKLKASSGSLQAGFSNIVAIPGGLIVGGADTLVATNPLADLAGKGGTRLVLNALSLRASGERMALSTVNVKPIFQGLTSTELHNLDLVLDLDADGRVDSTEQSVLAAVVDDGGSGVERTLSVLDTLPADTLRHYLLIADLDSTVRATDRLQIDVTNLSVGSGLTTGVVPAVPVRSVPGRDHVVTGQVDVIALMLEDPRIGQVGKLTIVFDTASDLVAGDEVVFDFPPGFDIAQTAVDSASVTPSGVLPLRSGESAGRTVVLDMGAAERRGHYQIVLSGLINPTSNQGASGLVVRTRLDDDTPIDSPDPVPPGLELTGSGQLELSAVDLRSGYAGGRGALSVALRTVSPLAPGDEITLVFPPGFDLSQVGVGDSTRTPSGTVPTVGSVDSLSGMLVIDVQASETAGAFALVLSGVGFPPTAAKDLTVVAQTRRDDDAAVDLADIEPALFALPGRLELAGGAAIANGLVGAAGVGGQLALTSFRLGARGEDLSVVAVELLPQLSGIQSGDLSQIDIVLDRDGDGIVDPGDSSVAVQTLNSVAHGIQVGIGLAAQNIASDSTRSYLVVGDVGTGISSTDRIQLDVVDIIAAAGPLSGVEPITANEPVGGTSHIASGFVELESVELSNRQTGASSSVALEFTTASALGAGARITLAFPPGFDLGSALLATASRAPSGAALSKDSATSTRGALVLELAAAETAGTYRVMLDAVINTAVAASDLTVEVSSSKAEGTLVDGPDPEPFLFAIVRDLLSVACRADFNGDGRVYFADLFLFGDAFGGAGSSIFDLDGDSQIGFSDFFIFTEVFGTECDSTGIDPVDDMVLALELRVEILGETAMDFALVRAGSFEMGSISDEEGRSADEGPQHTVAISQPFYLGQFEVTQGQWLEVMGTKPWEGLPAVLDSADHPAVYIGWNDAQAFVQTLNAAAGDSLYRLPTEAEWEYAARAGTQTRWSFGDAEEDLANFAWTRRVPVVVSELVTHPVGSKRSNAWGLYDMHGSAAEWALDYYGAYAAGAATDPLGVVSGSARVLRGGGLTLGALETRSAARGSFDSGVRLSTFGFRLLYRIPSQ